MTRLVLAATLATTVTLAACAGSGKPSGRYVGPVTPTTPGSTCTATRGIADITEGSVTFSPNQGTWLLIGDLTGITMRLERTQTGADKKPFSTRLEATMTPDAVNGTYTTPRCSFTVALKRV